MRQPAWTGPLGERPVAVCLSLDRPDAADGLAQSMAVEPRHSFEPRELPPSLRRRLAGLFLALGGVGAGHANEHPTRPEPNQTKHSRMWVTVGERRFAVTPANTDAARAFTARLPLTLDMTGRIYFSER